MAARKYDRGELQAWRSVGGARKSYFWWVGFILLEDGGGRYPEAGKVKYLTRSFQAPDDLATNEKEVRMRTSRMLVLMILVLMVTTLPIATSAAHASGFDEANRFAAYLCQYYLSCE